ncbi:MAG: Gldg family protein, partial [Planctomycetota bacterium]
ANSPITQSFDVLLAVQPSTLPQRALDNLLDAIRRGQPTAMFEDPFPFIDSQVAGTSRPRVNPGGNNPFMQQRQAPPEPKGTTEDLWSLLGIDFRAAEVVWDAYNPYPRVRQFPHEFVFVGAGSGSPMAFSEDSVITSGLQQVLLVFPSAISPRADSPLTFEPLLRAGAETGVVSESEILQRSFLGPSGLNPNRRFRTTREPYVLGARIRGTPPADVMDDDSEGEEAAGSINVVLIADIDMLYSVFFAMRARGQDPGTANIDVDNVTLVLNVLDELAGDDRFIEIRKRRPEHRTLSAVEGATEGARREADDARDQAMDDFELARAEAEAALQKTIEELQAREGIDPQQMVLEIATKQQVEQQRLDAKIARLERDRDGELAEIERALAGRVRDVEQKYKLLAVILPPIPPLLVGIVVLFRRRSLEKIGVPRERLRRAAEAKEHGVVAA